MATQIETNIYIDQGSCLTSQLREVAATTDLDYVTCSIWYYLQDGKKEQIYWSVLYASGGRVEISDVGALIEAYFRGKGIATGNIEIRFGDTSTKLEVLYCEVVKPAAWDFTEQLWIASHVQRVHYDSVVRIYAYVNSNIHGLIKIMGHRRGDGSLGVLEYPVQFPFEQSDCYEMDVKSKVDWALGRTTDAPESPLSDVAMLSFEYLESQVLLYLMDDTEYLTFEFRNIFNCPERVDICGTVKVKTEIDRNEAVSGGSTLQYDRKVTRSYEVETEALSDEDAKRVVQLIASHTAAVLIDGEFRKIIITDETCESSNDDESLTSYKFTWQFADRRLLDWDAAMPTHDGIFTQEYTEEYE